MKETLIFAAALMSSIAQIDFMVGYYIDKEKIVSRAVAAFLGMIFTTVCWSWLFHLLRQ